MRRHMSVPASVALFLTVLLLANCGMTVHPRAGSGERVRAPGQPAIGDPQVPTPPARTPTAGNDARPDVDRICRSASVPRGWIAIAYEAAPAGQCMSVRGESEYAVAVIERYDRRPVGSVMAVCADQPVPRAWLRESHGESASEFGCEGARVRSGSPTTYLMRRHR